MYLWTHRRTDGRTDRQTDKLIWGGLGNLSGEEVSVSLGYALRTTDRLTPPIRASKTEAPPKTRWNPKMKNLGMNQRKIPGRKKEKDQNRARTNPKKRPEQNVI